MKLITLLFCFGVYAAQAAGALEHLYNASFEIYGGTEDSGVSRTESYYFRATGKILLPDILWNKELMSLSKGDTLLVQVSSFRPYGTSLPVIQLEPEKKPCFDLNAYEIRTHRRIFIVNLNQSCTWNRTVRYRVGRKDYEITAPAEFKFAEVEAAP